MIRESKQSLLSFLLGLFILLGYLLLLSDVIFTPSFCFLQDAREIVVLSAYALVTGGIVRVLCRGEAFQVAVRGWVLGYILGVSVVLILSSSSYRLIGWFTAALVFFHWSEYFATSLTNPRNLSLSSYILDHSHEYHGAVVASLLEFTLEWYFIPELKRPGVMSALGLLVVLCGESLRKLAMWQASTNFNHYIRYRREEGHELVTRGIYSLCRHPSYVGWFYWSIATQVMVMNPVCTILYALFSWKFFSYRIQEEERTLLYFFGQEYASYQRNVPTGLPFISGFTVEPVHNTVASQNNPDTSSNDSQ